MPHSPPQHPRQPERSQTWPPSTDTRIASSNKEAATDAGNLDHATHESFLHQLDSNPEDHFLAPIHMYEYEDWAEASDSDEDDEAEDFEWDAGITDFALFASDRKQAEESNRPLPSKWNDLVHKQTSALQRALDRRREADALLQPADAQTLGVDDLPSLTPDTSPSIRDDLDVDSYHGQNESRPSVPNYLTITVTPPDEDPITEDRIADVNEEPPRLHFASAVKQRPVSHARRKRERPGLQHSRTMSGQEHAWKRPSTDMYTVGEEPDNERREQLMDSWSEAVDQGSHEGNR